MVPLGISKIVFYLKDGMFWHDNHWKLWTISILSLWNKFSEKQKSFPQTRASFFLVESTKIESTTFTQKLPCQKPQLRQIEWGVVQSGRPKKMEFCQWLLFFWKFCFRARISYKELIWCNNYPNINIHTFCKHCSFIWGCFVHVSVFATNVFPFASKWANVARNTTLKKNRV